jgi:hypothetical protein
MDYYGYKRNEFEKVKISASPGNTSPSTIGPEPFSTANCKPYRSKEAKPTPPQTDIKKDPSFLISLISLTWLRYPRTRGLTKHHNTKVTIFFEFTK